MRRFVSFGPAFVVLLTAAVTLFAGPAAVRRIGYAHTDATITLARAELDHDTVLEQINQAVRNISKAVEPSVVHIAVESAGRGPGGRQRVSQGSGWIYDQHGHIVTNAHVVRGARGEPVITIQFFDGRVAPGTLVAVDSSTDVAVIKVPEGDGVFPARRATGVEVAQGDRVYAFGSPFGFKFSMSEGIISGLGRSPAAVLERNGYTNFIQTDAAVNPGNSGGPLVDVDGRVVGMNVAIATGSTPSGGSEGQNSGISFAIPLDTIESVVDQIIDGGVVSKGFMGVALPLDPRARGNADSAEDYNRALLQAKGFSGRGVVISQVTPGSPAAKAGMLAGDVLTAVNNRLVTSIAAARQLITINRPGETVPVKVWRDGSSVEFNVVLADLAGYYAGLEKVANALNVYGAVFVDNPDEVGVVVAGVVPGSSAFQDGLRPGLLVNEVNGHKVSEIQELRAVLFESGFADGKKLTVGVSDADGRSAAIDMQYKP